MIVNSEQARAWFPAEPPAEVDVAHNAAESYVAERCRIPVGPVVPGDLVQAVRLLTARYLARRNSPDGTLGMSEFGVGRIATVDRDVEALIGPYRRVVFG